MDINGSYLKPTYPGSALRFWPWFIRLPVNLIMIQPFLIISDMLHTIMLKSRTFKSPNYKI